MKTGKRVFTLLLALVMVLGLSVTAFATEGTTTYSYEIYQIFTGTSSDGKFTNVKWGQNGTGTVGNAVDQDTLDALTAVNSSTSDSDKLEVILKYAKLTGDPYQTAEGTGETLEVSGLPNGYYLVKDEDGSIGDNDVYTTYVVQVVDGKLTISRKGSIPSVDKEIVDKTNKTNGTSSIGDTVSYQITGTLPSNLADYNEYYYSFTDTLSKGLTYNEDLKVTVEGKELTDYFYSNADSQTDGTTTITVAIQDLLALNLLEDDDEEPLVSITKDSEVVITYSATLNEDAVVGADPNTNDVLLDYSNNPSDSGTGTTTPPGTTPKEPTKPDATGETPKSTVDTYTTALTIKKVDGNGNILTGAEFTLTGDSVNVVLVTTSETFDKDENGTYYKLADGTYTTEAPTDVYESLTDKYSLNENTGEYELDENGIYWKLKNGTYTEKDPNDLYDSLTVKYTKKTTVTAKGTGKDETTVVGSVLDNGTVTFTGLGAGDYTITETKTPDGYNTIEPIKFTISFDADTKKFSSSNKDIQVETDNTLSATIVNKTGSELPSTGGIGTTIFYVVGSILVIGAAILLITKKRMSGSAE